MSNVTVYTNPGCSQCVNTFRALDRANVSDDAVDLSADAAALARIRELGYSQAPVVVTEAEH